MTKDNIKTGKRLQECIDIAKISKAELCRKIEKLPGGEKIPRQNITNYVNKGIPISEARIMLIAKALKIHAGYLLGDDNFLCENYYEYLEYMKLCGDPNFMKYNAILSPAKLILSASTTPDGKSITYTINPKGKRKEFNEAEMERFYNLVVDMIQKMASDYLTFDDFPLPGTLQDWKTFLKWHPDFFKNKTNKTYYYHLYEKALNESDSKAAGRPTTQKRKGEKKNERKNE